MCLCFFRYKLFVLEYIRMAVLKLNKIVTVLLFTSDWFVDFYLIYLSVESMFHKSYHIPRYPSITIANNFALLSSFVDVCVCTLITGFSLQYIYDQVCNENRISFLPFDYSTFVYEYFFVAVTLNDVYVPYALHFWGWIRTNKVKRKSFRHP